MGTALMKRPTRVQEFNESQLVTAVKKLGDYHLLHGIRAFNGYRLRRGDPRFCFLGEAARVSSFTKKRAWSAMQARLPWLTFNDVYVLASAFDVAPGHLAVAVTDELVRRATELSYRHAVNALIAAEPVAA